MKDQPSSVGAACPRLGLLLTTSLIVLLCSCGKPARAPSRADPILADRAFFGPEIGQAVEKARDYLDNELEKSAKARSLPSGSNIASAALSLTADFQLPTGTAPPLAEIEKKYGKPDRQEEVTKNGRSLTVHYFDDVGFAVQKPSDSGTVARLYVHRALPTKN